MNIEACSAQRLKTHHLLHNVVSKIKLFNFSRDEKLI